MAELAKYKYLGLSTVVEVDYPEPEVKLDLWGGNVGQYDGLDRFGRIVDHRWIDYGANPDVDVSRIQYGYDRNSNRLWRQNDVARAASKKFDQAYAYDGLNRLADFQRGLLDGNHAIPSNDLTFRQKWGLDAVGNWSCFDQDDDGDGTFDLKQQRATNTVNEITDITETTGPQWATPTYNSAGNTTTFPKPSDLTSNYTAEYDAWNRLVRIKDGANLVQKNEHDGRNFQVVKEAYSGGSLDETRHLYFTTRWQVVEERVGVSSDADRQFVWGRRYIDDLIVRDRDTDANTVLDERLYALQDANWSVTTLVAVAEGVEERYEYDAYGTSIIANKDWGKHSFTSHDWEIRFAGYRVDLGPGLGIVRLRQLHFQMGTFLTRDRLQYMDSLSLYQYVQSNPIILVDSMGTLPVSCDCKGLTKDAKDLVNGFFKLAIQLSTNHDDLAKNLIEDKHLNPTTQIRLAIKGRKIDANECECQYYQADFKNPNAKMKHIDDIGNADPATRAKINLHRRAMSLRGQTTSEPAILLCGHCIGVDKISHFLQTGLIGYEVNFKLDVPGVDSKTLSYWLEGLNPPGLTSTGWESLTTRTFKTSRGPVIPELSWGLYGDVLPGSSIVLNQHGAASPADIAADIGGEQFWFDLMWTNKLSEFNFDICRYMSDKWDHTKNPNVPGAIRNLTPRPPRPK